MDEVEYKHTPLSPRVGQPFTLKTGSPDAVDVAPDTLHRASGDTQRLTVLRSDRALDATSQRPVTPSGVRVNFTLSLSLGPDATQCVRC